MWAWALGKRPGRPWVLMFNLIVYVVLGVALIGMSVLSEQGQALLPEVALLVGGPLALAGLAWATYRIWYRKRYPDG